MLKSLPKIIIIFSVLITPMLLGASYANAAIYTCKNPTTGACSGQWDTNSYPAGNNLAQTCASSCQAANPNATCVLYDSSTGCVDQTRTAPAETTTQGSASFVPQVGVGNDFQAGESYTPDGSTAMIAKYIRAIYKYAIGIVGILAAVVLMIGGVMWIVAGGNATAIGEAKSWIGASLTGLLIALMSYLILATVNPALVDFKTTGIKTVTPPPVNNSTGTGCCLGGSNLPYYFGCKDDTKSADCKIGLFPASDGITKVLFAESKKCKNGTGIAKLCE